MPDIDPWEDIWTDEHGGFPWWMDPEAIDDQKEEIRPMLDKALDIESFTKDYPVLNLFEDHYIFVYGTLKYGYSNHRVINNKDCTFIADAFSTHAHFLLKQTRGGIPALLGTFGQTNKAAKHVKGELYLVKTKMLPALDAFEQNGVIYKRTKLLFSVPYPADKDELVPAWTYVGIKSAWESANETLDLCPSFTRTSQGLTKEYYSYMGKA